MTNESDLANAMLSIFRQHRVTRQFAPEPLSREALRPILEAGYWAPSGGNRKPVRVIATTDEETVRHCVTVSPGIYGRPPAILLLCIDWSRAPHIPREQPRESDSIMLDVGSSLAHMLLQGDVEGIGMCPVMSFHRDSLRAVMHVPPEWTPVIMVIAGRKGNPEVSDRVKPPANLDQYVRWRGADASDDADSHPLPLTEERVRAAFLAMATFCAAAAHGNVAEHASYAPVRLLQGVQRIAQILGDLGLSTPELDEIGNRIGVDSIKLMKDHERLRGVADEVLHMVGVDAGSATLDAAAEGTEER